MSLFPQKVEYPFKAADDVLRIYKTILSTGVDANIVIGVKGPFLRSKWLGVILPSI